MDATAVSRHPIARTLGAAPRDVKRTGDDTAAGSVFGCVRRITEWHQVATYALAAVVALLSLPPLEPQRRIISEVVSAGDISILAGFGAAYLGLILSHQGTRYARNLLNALAPLTMLLPGGYLVIQGEVGVIAAFILVFEKISSPLRELISFCRVAAQSQRSTPPYCQMDGAMTLYRTAQATT